MSIDTKHLIPANDRLFYTMQELLTQAKEALVDVMVGQRGNAEIALCDIRLSQGRTLTDLPGIVATVLAKPFGSLGLDNSPWGPTTSPWYLFQHLAEDYIDDKISRCKLRKLAITAERLALAKGCLQWASLNGIYNIKAFRDGFTSALLIEKDATAEMNGETITVHPTDSDVPLNNAILLDIRDKQIQQGKILELIAKDSAAAAAKNKSQLKAAESGGRKSALSRRVNKCIDPVRQKVTTWVQKKIKEFDKIYPERSQKGYKGSYSNACIYRMAEHNIPSNQDASGKPIFTALQIKEWFKPSKQRRRKASL